MSYTLFSGVTRVVVVLGAYITCVNGGRFAALKP